MRRFLRRNVDGSCTARRAVTARLRISRRASRASRRTPERDRCARRSRARARRGARRPGGATAGSPRWRARTRRDRSTAVSASPSASGSIGRNPAANSAAARTVGSRSRRNVATRSGDRLRVGNEAKGARRGGAHARLPVGEGRSDPGEDRGAAEVSERGQRVEAIVALRAPAARAYSASTALLDGGGGPGKSSRAARATEPATNRAACRSPGSAACIRPPSAFRVGWVGRLTSTSAATASVRAWFAREPSRARSQRPACAAASRRRRGRR